METNFYPINIEFEKFQISRTSYSEEDLRRLREQYNHTHSFFRNGDFIYISNKDSEETLIIGDEVEVNTFSDSEITSSLIKHIFFRTFKDRFPKIIPVAFYPFRIFSTQQKDDLVYDLLPQQLKNIVSYKKLIEIQLRMINLEDRVSFGFIINTQRQWILNKSCLDLNNEGFTLLNAEVLHNEDLPGLNNVLAPNEEFIGIIKSITDDVALLETNEGEKNFHLAELTLRRTKYNIHNYLAFTTSEEICEKIFNDLEKKKPDSLNPKNERLAIRSIAELLALEKIVNGTRQQIQYQNKEGFFFTISAEPYCPANSFQLKAPTFIFDHAGNKTDNAVPDRGLSTFGPYDSLNFDIKSPNILGICLKDNRGSFATFLGNLIEGLPNSHYFKKGLKKKYDLLEVSCSIHEVGRYDYAEYNRVISSIEKKPDLVLIEIPEEFKKLDDKVNPYYRLKARLLTLEIPIQFVLNRKMRIIDEYLLNSIALQLYAKLGGTPWVLPSAHSVDREIIIGIGHSIIRKNVYSGSEQNRVVGISTFFSGDGQYLLSNKARDVPYSEYFGELLKNLQDSFQKLNEQQGWKEGDTIRLIFHIFKPIRNVEFNVISELIKQFPLFRIQFAFVTISKTHPYMLFDPQQQGIRAGYVTKGEFVPPRGTNIILDSSSCLVQMLGAKEIKTGKHAASRPILIRIRMPQGNYDASVIEDLLFTDLQYIVQQVFSFTYLSWRGFLPGEVPATMLYSNLISNLLGKLRKIDGWQPDVLNFNLKRKKWFL